MTFSSLDFFQISCKLPEVSISELNKALDAQETTLLKGNFKFPRPTATAQCLSTWWHIRNFPSRQAAVEYGQLSLVSACSRDLRSSSPFTEVMWISTGSAR